MPWPARIQWVKNNCVWVGVRTHMRHMICRNFWPFLPNRPSGQETPESSRHRIDSFEQGWKNVRSEAFGIFGLFAFDVLVVENVSFQPCFRGWSKNTVRLKIVKCRYTCVAVPYWMDFHHILRDINFFKLIFPWFLVTFSINYCYVSSNPYLEI